MSRATAPLIVAAVVGALGCPLFVSQGLSRASTNAAPVIAPSGGTSTKPRLVARPVNLPDDGGFYS
jgi:hypothetical protein